RRGYWLEPAHRRRDAYTRTAAPRVSPCHYQWPACRLLAVVGAARLHTRLSHRRPQRRRGTGGPGCRCHLGWTVSSPQAPTRASGGCAGVGSGGYRPDLDHLDRSRAALLASAHTLVVRGALALLARRPGTTIVVLSHCGGALGQPARRVSRG